MVENLYVDIFKLKCDALIHCCNCQHTFGSGVARLVRETYPEAHKADLETPIDCKEKLGTFSCVKAHDGKYIYNMYSQFRFGADRRQTDYEAFYNGLTGIHSHIKNLDLKTASIPFKVASDRGGASWRVIESMIYDIFEESNISLYICKYIPNNSVSVIK